MSVSTCRGCPHQTDAYKRNPDIFVRTLGDNRETPRAFFFFFFRQLIKFDSFEEEIALQDVRQSHRGNSAFCEASLKNSDG